MATVEVLGPGRTTALIFKCRRVVCEEKNTSFYASDRTAYWSTGFGFDMPVVINNNPELRQPEYKVLTFPGHVRFRVIRGAVKVEAK